MASRRQKAAQRKGKHDSYGVGSPGVSMTEPIFISPSTGTRVQGIGRPTTPREEKMSTSRDEPMTPRVLCEEQPTTPRALPGGLRKNALIEIVDEKWANFEEELYGALARVPKSTENRVFGIFEEMKDSLFGVVSDFIQPLVRTFYTLNAPQPKVPTQDTASSTTPAPLLLEVGIQVARANVSTKHCQTVRVSTDEKFTIVGKREKLELLSATCGSQTEESETVPTASASPAVHAIAPLQASISSTKKKLQSTLVLKKLPKTAILSDVQTQLGVHGFACSRLFRLHKNGASMRTVFAVIDNGYEELPTIDNICGHPVSFERFCQEAKKEKRKVLRSSLHQRNYQKASNKYNRKTSQSLNHQAISSKDDDLLLTEIVKFTKGHFVSKNPADIFNAATKVWTILKTTKA